MFHLPPYKKVVFLLRIVVVFMAISLRAGQHNLDSLKQKYYAASDKKTAAKILISISNAYSVKDFDSSIVYAGKILEQVNDPDLHATAHRLLAYAYFNKNNYTIALDYYLKASAHYESRHNDTMLAQVYNNIGQMCYYNGNRQMAKDYWSRSIEKAKRVKALVFLSDVLNNLGAVCWDEKNFDKALEYYKESAAMDLQRGEYANYAASLNNIAQAYGQMYDEQKNEKYNKLSHNFYEQSLLIIDSIPYNIYTLPVYFSVAEAFLKFGRPGLAQSVLSKAESKSPNIINKDYLKLLNIKSKILFETKQTAEAFVCLKRYAYLKDSLYAAESNERLIEAEAKYQNHQKEKEIEIQKISLEKKDLELHHTKNIEYLLAASVLLLLVVAFLIYRRYTEKRTANKIISSQKDEVEKQKQVIEHQKYQVEEHQKEIIDSINYARRIQYALLTHSDLIGQQVSDHFIFFQPKDIVSGDFYWATIVQGPEIGVRVEESNSGQGTQNSELFFLAVCDSTGHGVPGAFMSLLNTSFLNEAVNEKNLREPHKILNYVRQRLIENISKDGSQDGMDAVLLCIEKQSGGSMKITYAAANHKPVVISNNRCLVLTADKMPVANGAKSDDFQLRSIEAGTGDRIYLLTDGYSDQFGGPQGKKYKYGKLIEMLNANSDLPMQQQKEIIEKEFFDWKENRRQVDDICIIGIRL